MLDPVPAAGLEPDEKKGGDHMSDIKGEYGLFIDYEYCSGCNACLTACNMEHDMPESDFGIRIFQDGPVQYSDGSWHYDYLPMPTDLRDLVPIARPTASCRPACTTARTPSWCTARWRTWLPVPRPPRRTRSSSTCGKPFFAS